MSDENFGLLLQVVQSNSDQVNMMLSLLNVFLAAFAVFSAIFIGILGFLTYNFFQDRKEAKRELERIRDYSSSAEETYNSIKKVDKSSKALMGQLETSAASLPTKQKKAIEKEIVRLQTAISEARSNSKDLRWAEFELKNDGMYHMTKQGSSRRSPRNLNELRDELQRFMNENKEPSNLREFAEKLVEEDELKDHIK